MKKKNKEASENMKHRKNMKKAQLEMIGLTVIVVIVIIAMMIFMVYKIGNPREDIKKRYMDKEIATNFLIAMTNTNVAECNNLTLSSLIADCARDYHQINCYDLNSCQAANQTIHTLLSRTLDEWGLNYNLSVQNTDISFVNQCKPGSDQVSGFSIIPRNPGQVEVSLRICQE